MNGGIITDAVHDWSSGFTGINTRTVGNSSGNGPQFVLPADSVPAGDRDLGDIVTDIIGLQRGVLGSWQSAVLIFDKVMTSASDKEASANFQKSISNYVANALIDKVVGSVSSDVPGLKEAVGLIKSLADETHRAGVAGASAKLKDFIVAQLQMVDALNHSLDGGAGGAIIAAKKLQQAFDASTGPCARSEEGRSGRAGYRPSPIRVGDGQRGVAGDVTGGDRRSPAIVRSIVV